jgi:hypothetical protein
MALTRHKRHSGPNFLDTKSSSTGSTISIGLLAL